MAGFGFSEKLTIPNFPDGILCIFWVGLSYSASIAITLQLLDPGGSASTALLVVVGSMFAQIWSSLQLVVAKRCFYGPVHIPHCRAFQSFYAFMVWTRQRSICAGILAAIFTYGACPRLLLWLPILKRPAALPQPNSKRPRQHQVDVKISSLQSIDTTTGNTHDAGVESTSSYKKAKHNEDYDESCHCLATKLTRTANREISAVRPKAKGLEFEVSFKFIGTTKGNRQSKPFRNFQCEASVAGKVVRTVDVPVRNDKIKGALQSTEALLHFPKAFKTALKAQVLLDVAAESARTALEKYKGCSNRM